MRDTILVLLLSVASTARADVPQVATYSGYLADDGEPVNGEHDMTFRLFTTPSEGDPVFEEFHDNVRVTDGHFTVPLGEGLGDDLFDATLWNGAQLWLEVEVDGPPPLEPRSPVRSVPYAIRAGVADSLGDIAPDDVALAGHEHDWADITTGVPSGFSDGIDDEGVRSVTASTGLTGGTITDTGTFAVAFGGSGAATTAARSDHIHDVFAVSQTLTNPGDANWCFNVSCGSAHYLGGYNNGCYGDGCAVWACGFTNGISCHGPVGATCTGVSLCWAP